MRVLILGATGFLGSRLLNRLVLGAGVPGWQHESLDIVATDVREPLSAWPGHHRQEVTFVRGNFRDSAFLDVLFATPFDVVFHLAATLAVESEKNFELGMDMNVHGLIALLNRCRDQARAPRLVFASSISTFGGVLPPVVDDTVAQTPQTSYGVHKVIGEQLINDYSRRGYLDGRVLRLAVVLTHPGPPSSSVSDRIAALIREPLRGVDVNCPFDPDTPIAVVSARQVVDGLMRVAVLPVEAFSATRAMNLPATSTTPAAIVQAVALQSRQDRIGKVTWMPDAQMQKLISTWPSRFTSELALRHGITGDTGLADIIADHLENT